MNLTVAFVLPAVLVLAPVWMQAAAPASSLWAMQAFVPPGTNDAQALQTVVPVAVPVGGGGVVSGELAPGVPMPGAGARPAGGPPIGPDGRMPGLPPGVPLGPRSSGPGTAQPQAPRTGGMHADRMTQPEVTKEPAPAEVKPIACSVQLTLARTDLPSTGGEFVVPAVVQPSACQPAVSFSSTWIRLLDPESFRFLAEPNTSTVARDALIAIGDSRYFVRQEPPAQPGLAAAPSKLVFGIDKRGKAETKRITGWTEHGSGAITARAGDSWLSVTPRQGKDKRQAYDVTIKHDAGLGPGRHDSYIELTPGDSTASLRIPVVVEVPVIN